MRDAAAPSRALPRARAPARVPLVGERVGQGVALAGVALVVAALALLAGYPLTWALAGGGGVVALILAACSTEAGLAILMLAVAGTDRVTLYALSLPLMGGGLKPPDVLLLCVLGGWAVRVVRRRRSATPAELRAGLREPVLVMLLLLVAWATVAAARGVAQGAYYKEALLELRPLLQYLFLLPLLTEWAPGRAWRLTWLVLLVGAVAATRALVLYAVGAGQAASYVEGTRVLNVAIELTVMALLLEIALLLERHRDRWLIMGLALLGVAGISVTLYRSVMLGLGVAVIVVVALARPRVRWRAVGFVPAVLAGAVALQLLRPGGGTSSAFTVLAERAASISDYGQDVSAQHRLREWRAAAEMIRDAPLLGHGPGARIRFYSPMYGNGRWGFWSDNIYVHSAYLWTWVKLGGIGVVLLFGAVAAAFFTAAHEARRAPPGDRRALLGGLVAALSATLVVGLFGPSLSSDDAVPSVVLCLATLVLMARVRERRPGAPIPTWPWARGEEAP